MALVLEMKHGWRNWERDRNDSTYWSLKRADNVFNLKLPSDKVLRRIWNEVFPEKKYRPFRVIETRELWGCIIATPKHVPLPRRRRFLLKVAENRATGER